MAKDKDGFRVQVRKLIKILSAIRASRLDVLICAWIKNRSQKNLEALCEAYSGMAYALTEKLYLPADRNAGIDKDDIIQEGQKAVIEAIQGKWKPSNDTPGARKKIGAYIWAGVKGAIKDCLGKERDRIYSKIKCLECEGTGRILYHLRNPKEPGGERCPWCGGDGYLIKKPKKMASVATPSIFDDDSEEETTDGLAGEPMDEETLWQSKRFPSPPEAAMANDRKRIILEILSDLPDRDREMIKLRFGFYDREHTLEEIGRTFSLSKGRVHQIINDTMGKIGKSPKGKTLEDFP